MLAALKQSVYQMRIALCFNEMLCAKFETTPQKLGQALPAAVPRFLAF